MIWVEKVEPIEALESNKKRKLEKTDKTFSEFLHEAVTDLKKVGLLQGNKGEK